MSDQAYILGYLVEKQANSLREALGQYAGYFSDPFLKDNVPVRQAIQTVERDSYLRPGQRELVSSIFQGAEGRESGLTSGKKIARSAVRAGVGYGSGYLFGRTAASLFSMPSSVITRLSRIGGIAGALINTGIFEKGD